MDKIGDQASFEDIKKAVINAHNVTNEALHADSSIDDSLAGTTSISVVCIDNRLIISNVGDSRAIIASLSSDGRLVAKALSNDQTPYRKDERERVKQYGARILSMDQIEGIEPIHVCCVVEYTCVCGSGGLVCICFVFICLEYISSINVMLINV